MQDPVEVYQIKIWLRNISPSIWRRLLVRSDSTIAELHYIIQIVMRWPNIHLHQFTIRGKEYGISYAGGIGFSDNPKQVRLDKFRFRLRERFIYEYNFHDNWCHEIRIENILPVDNNRVYPVCISGKISAPLDDCGGAWSFMSLRRKYPPNYVAYRILEILKEKSIATIECFKDLVHTLDRVKWLLWHGNVFRTLEIIEDIEEEIECYQYENEGTKKNTKLNKFYNTVIEFGGYISSNRNFIPNYQDRHYYGETISTAFVESTVNEVISKRMKKKQQMCWTKKGAHLLLQVRIKTLNGTLDKTFQRWYPEMKMAS